MSLGQDEVSRQPVVQYSIIIDRNESIHLPRKGLGVTTPTAAGAGFVLKRVQSSPESAIVSRWHSQLLMCLMTF